jgi:hypothetical protein
MTYSLGSGRLSSKNNDILKKNNDILPPSKKWLCGVSGFITSGAQGTQSMGIPDCGC